MNRARVAVVALLVGLASGSAGAVDGVSLEWGADEGSGAKTSDEASTYMTRVALQWDWNRQWFQGKNWHVGGFWDVGAGYWRRDALPGQNKNLFEIGLTPVFRLQQNDLRGVYVEAGVGAYLLSQNSLGEKRYGTRFQFGSHLGVGYRFGARHAFDLGYAFQHRSNGTFKRPNDGADFHEIRLQYHL